MSTSIGTLPNGTVAVDFWFDSSLSTGTFPASRDKASFNFGDKSLQNCIGMQVLGVTAPCSYYVIDLTNNQFLVTVTDSGAKVYMVSITPGTYTASNIVTQMQLDMTSNTTVVSGGGSATDLTAVYSMAVLVDASTSQMLFYQTVAAASGKPFAISFPATVNSVQDVIGFPSATTSSVFSSSAGTIYDNSSTVINAGASTNYLYSPYFVQLSGPLYMILNSDLASGTDQPPMRLPPQQDAQQLEMVIVNSNYDGTITTAPSEKVTMLNANSPVCSGEFWFTLGSRTAYTHYSLTGSTTTKNHLSFNGGSFLVGIRFFISTKSTQSIESNINSGDKVTKTVPVSEGVATGLHERHINGGVVMKKPKKPKTERQIPKRRKKVSI